jgi:hypothetical protein
MTPNISPIVAKVCKSAGYSEHKYDKSQDLLCAKITNIHEDGSRSNSFIAIKNYKQPFWIVKDTHRHFKQHKDYIKESMVREYNQPRCRIPFEVKKQLYGAADNKASMYDVKKEQFVFGLDQTPPVHFKRRFFEKYGEIQEKEPYTLAAFDVEADMDDPEQPIICASVTMKDKAYFAGVRGWYKEDNDEDILDKLKEAEEKYVKEHVERRNCKIAYELFDTPGQVVAACIGKFHEWEPDWVASWNAAYDMEACEKALIKEGYDLADVYCDPRVPREFRSYEYNPGRTHKVKENGDRTPLEPQEKFPSVRCQATWKWADAMSVYAIKRFPFGKLESYSLEAISNREEVPGKLYTDEGRQWGNGSPQWHRNMQRYQKYLYSIYNIADNWPIEEINEKTFDFTLSLPMLLRYSEYFNFVSQPTLISDTLSFVAKEHGYVWGSTPPKRDTYFSDRLPTLGDWIALLDTEKNASQGSFLFEGLLDVQSQGRGATSDLDVEGAYPTGTLTGNVSNATTMMEVYRIQGADAMQLREIAVNYASSPAANAIGLGHALYRFPKVSDMVEVFERCLRERGMEDVLYKLQNAEAANAPVIDETLNPDLPMAA